MNTSRDNIRRLGIIFNIQHKVFEGDFETALYHMSLLREEYLSFDNGRAAEICEALITKYNSNMLGMVNRNLKLPYIFN